MSRSCALTTIKAMLLRGSRMSMQPELLSIDGREIHKLATRVLPRQAQHELPLPNQFYNGNAGSWSSWPQRRGDGLVSKVQGSSSGAAISPLSRLQIAIGNNRAKRRNSSQHHPNKVNSHSASVNMGKTAWMHLKTWMMCRGGNFFPKTRRRHSSKASMA